MAPTHSVPVWVQQIHKKPIPLYCFYKETPLFFLDHDHNTNGKREKERERSEEDKQCDRDGGSDNHAHLTAMIFV